MLKKKIWANFQRIGEVFTQKIFNMLSNIWVWDPGSGKNPFRIPDPGVKKAPDPGSGSATLVRLSFGLTLIYLLKSVGLLPESFSENKRKVSFQKLFQHSFFRKHS
jgi:hypothetical protein